MRILIVKTSALGDIVHAFPVLEWLKQEFPEAKVDWIVEKNGATLLQAHPSLHRVLVVDTKKWRRSLFRLSTWKEIGFFLRLLRNTQYDVLFDLQGNTKSAFFTAFAVAARKIGFGRRCVREWPNLLVTHQKKDYPVGVNVREANLFLCRSFFSSKIPSAAVFSPLQLLRLTLEEEVRKQEILSIFSSYPCLMVCPGSRWENKKLEDACWIRLLQEIHRVYSIQFCLIYSGDEEKKRVEAICQAVGGHTNILGHLTLPLWQSIMAKMAGVLAVDSVGLHLAETADVPTFSLFGPSSSTVFAPSGERHVSVQGSCPYHEKFLIRCPRLRTCSTGACLKQLSADQIFIRFQEWWKVVESQHASRQGLQLL